MQDPFTLFLGLFPSLETSPKNNVHGFCVGLLFYFCEPRMLSMLLTNPWGIPNERYNLATSTHLHYTTPAAQRVRRRWMVLSRNLLSDGSLLFFSQM